ncbi:MFS transporter, partial [Streptomyces sp. T-3]|nr:MFS transporter [Streptomyces sp. T-3]
AALTGLALLFGLGTAFQAIPGMPLWASFAVLLGLGMVAALGGGVRYGLLNEILAKDGYLLGRSVLNMCAGTMQICGFALGGVLVATLSARGTLLVGAGLYLCAAAVARCGLTRRAPRAEGRPSIAHTWRNNTRLWSSKPRRYVYLALWVPNGLVVGCESL